MLSLLPVVPSEEKTDMGGLLGFSEVMLGSHGGWCMSASRNSRSWVAVEKLLEALVLSACASGFSNLFCWQDSGSFSLHSQPPFQPTSTYWPPPPSSRIDKLSPSWRLIKSWESGVEAVRPGCTVA